MKVKTRRTMMRVLFALSLGILALLCLTSFSKGMTTASAATTPKYMMAFSYSHTYTHGTGGGTTTTPTSGTNVYSASVMCGYNKYAEVRVDIYGSAASSTTTSLPSGGVINSDTITIEITSGFSNGSFTVYNSAGKSVGSGGKTIKLTGLSDGLYTAKGSFGSAVWTENARAGGSVSMTGEFSFTVSTHTHNYTQTVTQPTCTSGGYTTYKCSCGDTYTGNQTSALGHNYVGTTTAATCTSGGYTTYKCSRCSSSYTDNRTSALGHSYNTTVSMTCTGEITTTKCSRCGDSHSETTGEGIGHSYVATTTEATCTSGGYTTYKCSRCSDTYTGNSTSALGHSLSTARSISCTVETTVYDCSRCNYSLVSTAEGYGHNYVASITEPTCTSGGYTIFTCSNCGDSYKDNITQPLGHNYSVAQNSSCTGGTTTYKCARCGHSYSEDAQSGAGHTYVASITAATCNEKGYTIYTCSRCGDSYRDNETQPVGHNYIPAVQSATCTTSGYTLYTCSRCNHSYRSGDTQATGHNYVSTAYAATCSEGGFTLHECDRCGASYKDNETQPLGHNYATSVVPSTCTEGGKTIYHCQVCDYERSESDGTFPTGHDYTSRIIKEATCADEGLRRSTCDTCGYTYETKITAHGHSYEITDVRTTNGNTKRTYTCSACRDTYTQELGNQYAEVSNYVEYLFEQYSPYMIWVFLATAGVWSIAIGVALIIAHKNEDKEKAKKMLINYVIGLVVIFAILVACPYLVRGIAALVT